MFAVKQLRESVGAMQVVLNTHGMEKLVTYTSQEIASLGRAEDSHLSGTMIGEMQKMPWSQWMDDDLMDVN